MSFPPCGSRRAGRARRDARQIRRGSFGDRDGGDLHHAPQDVEDSRNRHAEEEQQEGVVENPLHDRHALGGIGCRGWGDVRSHHSLLRHPNVVFQIPINIARLIWYCQCQIYPVDARQARRAAAASGIDMRSKALKRWVIGPLLAAGLGLAPAAWLLRADVPRGAPDVTVLYVGAADCAPCRAWRRGAGAAFRASDEFARLTYREVEARTLFEVLSDEVWPDDLRAYRARIDAAMGVPLWIVVADGRVAAQGFGASEWSDRLLPTIRWLMH